jgi:acyl carrier protein
MEWSVFLPETPEPSIHIETVKSKVRKLMVEVLGKTVHDEDDYWEAGGDSRQAVRLAAMVQREFGMPFPARQFLGEPSVDGLSRTVWAALAEREGG